VAPDGREVAVARRVGDVVVSARGGMKTEMTMFFFRFFH
jgi:formylmethanofuran dehydrogenase subunit D